MPDTDGGSRSALRALLAAAVALAGLAFSFTPWSERLDNAILDAQWKLLRAHAPREGPDDIIVVGVDEATLREIAEPPGLWHVPLGTALTRVARARPRAIALDLPLPERSFDAFKPGLDRAMFDGLVAAGEAAPFVVSLNIDPATREARRIHTPFLAALGEARLGVGLSAVDADGVTRRFSLRVPTEDGGFPTLVGRLCRVMAQPCSDGLIDFALGPPVLYVPLHNVLAAPDEKALQRLFAGRIVLMGQARQHGDRLAVPVNLAGWEAPGGSSPAIVVHAATLRTALAGAPREASRPAIIVCVSLAALLALVRPRSRNLVAVVLAALGAFLASLYALRAGYHLPLGSVLATLLAAAVTANIPHRR